MIGRPNSKLNQTESNKFFEYEWFKKNVFIPKKLTSNI